MFRMAPRSKNKFHEQNSTVISGSASSFKAKIVAWLYALPSNAVINILIVLF